MTGERQPYLGVYFSLWIKEVSFKEEYWYWNLSDENKFHLNSRRKASWKALICAVASTLPVFAYMMLSCIFTFFLWCLNKLWYKGRSPVSYCWLCEVLWQVPEKGHLGRSSLPASGGSEAVPCHKTDTLNHTADTMDVVCVIVTREKSSQEVLECSKKATKTTALKWGSPASNTLLRKYRWKGPSKCVKVGISNKWMMERLPGERYLPVCCTETDVLGLKFPPVQFNKNKNRGRENGKPLCEKYLCWKKTKIWEVIRKGKRKKAWKKVVSKVCFVGHWFMRKLFKYERPIRSMGFQKAHGTHPELEATCCLPILGVKKNSSSALQTTLVVLTNGTVTGVKVSWSLWHTETRLWKRDKPRLPTVLKMTHA